MKKTLLIVEDSPETIDLLKWRAERQGFDCMLDDSGTEWIKHVKSRKPDAVILDLNLPRMSGLGILREFRKRPDLADVPVFILSGIDDIEIREAALALGACGYFLKDDNIDHVLTTISRRIGQETKSVEAEP